MKEEHHEWIFHKGYFNPENAINKCNEATREMLIDFPELTVQVGFCNGKFHCWLRDEHENIIDPTQSQFSNPEYTLVAERFLRKHEVEPSTGAIFLDEEQ